MSPVVRAWLAFAAVGAGLIHLALALGAPVTSAVVFTIVGAVEFGWGLFVMASSRLIAPRAAMAGALVPAAFWVVAILAAAGLALPQLASSLRVLPLLVATLFEFAIAVIIAISLRRPRRATSAPEPSTGRFLAGLAGGALIVAALTLPALAATQAAEIALAPGTLDGIHGH